MPPHITEYFEFVEDKSVFGLTKNGEYIVKSNVTTTIAKLYIYFNWERYIKMGNSPSALWNVMANLKNDNDQIRFNKLGYQTTKPAMLQLDSPQFMGLIADEYINTRTINIFRIFIYIIVSCIMIFFFTLDKRTTNNVWDKLMELSKKIPFLD